MKDPAFLFYTSDFLTGVSDLTMEERGQYITLLCLQHQKGRLTKKMIGISLGNATADVMAKLRQDEEGRYYSPRLEKEVSKRSEYAEKQKQRALEGWKKRKAKAYATANATALPLENENENEVINKNESKGVQGEGEYSPYHIPYTEKFKNIWCSWKKHLESKEKILSPQQSEAVLMTISRTYGEDESLAIAAVSYCLERGWLNIDWRHIPTISELRKHNSNVKSIKNGKKVVASYGKL